MTTIGFSGTQVGCTVPQSRALLLLFREYDLAILHQGDCVGADILAHCHALRLGASVVLHPPENPKLRAFSPMLPGEIVWPLKGYLDRNKDIVEESEILVATPKEELGGADHPDHLRSGTWSTVRCALKLHRPVYIIRPSGTVEEWV